MARRTKKEIMAGVEATKSKVVANNTVQYFTEDGCRVVRLHLTDILTFRPDGSVVLNSDGWQTVTTKSRMNDYLPAGWTLYQEKNVWYLANGYWNERDRQVWVYKDGMIIRPDGSVDGAGPSVEYLTKLQKQIKGYVDGFISKLVKRQLDAPNAGDCWSCALFKDADAHVMEHVKEKYYTGSLLMNAIEAFPVSQAAQHCLGYWYKYHDQEVGWDEGIGKRQVKSSLLRYMRRCLGLAS